jgi:hypothetical protein
MATASSRAGTRPRKELAAADEQTPVFGDSNVDPAVRQFLFEILSNLTLDEAILEARHGWDAFNAARRAATILAQFADFNSGSRDSISHSRDWYMAANVLEAPSTSRFVYWAHNAYVAAPENGRTRMRLPPDRDHIRRRRLPRVPFVQVAPRSRCRQ